MRTKTLLSLITTLLVGTIAPTLAGDVVCTADAPGALTLASAGKAVPILADEGDWWGVLRAAGDLGADFERATDARAEVLTTVPESLDAAIIVGTLGKSALIDQLAAAGKIDAKLLEGRWEAYLLQVVDNPVPGVARALVIAGSDKRGTIYGIYTLSKQIGVSPWYWWADVPTAHRDAIHVAGSEYDDGPTVKYRGIFINDEAPAFSGWAREKFGGVNSECYSHMFELLLRLKGNYLWPAMWNNAFNEDDPESPRLADAYGIVMGTSHHEPMIRSQKEWHKNGSGPWNYEKNGEVLREFWREGIRRNKDFESIVTMGMRGDGDEAMSEDTNTALLERIVADQRQIIEEETGRPASEVPQLWALYKEVQDYYEHGMRVPDDVTLLWCDDNWGNIRRLPLTEERKRSGGAGIYYHFDYVGGPRSYKWLNTVHLTKVWEQMHLAWQYEATRIWIVNVGDLKPLELPISFFLDYGWDPEALPYESLPAYTRNWAAQQFGEEYADEAAYLLDGYTRLNSLRKPEMTSAGMYSAMNYGEAARMLGRWNELADRSAALDALMPEELGDAFYQLVHYPVTACANLNEMYISAGRNDLYAFQGRAAANAMADRTRECFDRDEELARIFNEELAGGKWAHMMDQHNIGWTYWQQPTLDRMPAVSYVHPLPFGAIGVALDGWPFTWPENDIFQPKPRPLPIVQNGGKAVFEVFSRGALPVDWKIVSEAPWAGLRVDGCCGKTQGEMSGTLEASGNIPIELVVDWAALPADATEAIVKVSGMGPEGPCLVTLRFPILRDTSPAGSVPVLSGCVAVDARDYARAVAAQGVEWRNLDGFAPFEYGGAVTSFPVVHERIAPAPGTPCLEYDVFFAKEGTYEIELQLAPTLNFLSGDGIQVAVSFDDDAPQLLTVGTKVGSPDWDKAVAEGIRKLRTSHQIASPGLHVMKVWYVDPGVVVRRILLNTGALRPSYLGPVMWKAPDCAK